MKTRNLFLLLCFALLPVFSFSQIPTRIDNCVKVKNTYTFNPNANSSFSMTCGGLTQFFTFAGDEKNFCFGSIPSTFTLSFNYSVGALPTDVATISFSTIDAMAIGSVLSVPSGGCTIFKITKLASYSTIGGVYLYNLLIYPYYPC